MQNKGKTEGFEDFLASQCHFSPWNIMEQIPLEAISRHAKGKKIVGKKQDEFAQSKLFLTSLIALCDEHSLSA